MHTPAEILFLNGDIYTGARQTFTFPPVEVLPRVQALAVAQGKIIGAGTDQQARACSDRNTRVVDLGGRFAMPGFNDAHVHLVSAGFEKLNVSLAGTRSVEEMKARVAERARAPAAPAWIRGRGWDENWWQERRLPTRLDLDEVSAGIPVMLHRADSHVAVVNTAALQAAGISAATPDPAAGKIDRDSRGQPTGILRETAMDLVAQRMPPARAEERRRAIELALREAAQSGVTSLQDNSDWENFAVFEELAREGKLSLRLREWLDFKAPVELLKQRRAHPGCDRLATGMLKGFMDGSLGSRTAALLAPYSDDPDNAGLPRYDSAELSRMVEERAREGFQVGLHAIGDAGAELALRAFAAANGAQLRFRIEHAQVTTPQQIERFRQLNVIASVQPGHLLTDMHWAGQRLGPERARHSYAWASLARSGVRLAFGTDYPIEAITPFRGLYAAITRRSVEGDKAYYPEEAVSIDQALAAYTSGSAYAEFAEEGKGTLEEGMFADFVVLDRDLTRTAPEQVLQTRILRTVVGGETVFEAP